MQQLQQIKASYDWIFGYLSQEIFEATKSSDLTGLIRLEGKRDMIERGMFVLMFGQFERAVNDKFVAARDARIGNSDWTIRRGWDADILRTKKIAFETKLALVMDRNSLDFPKILDAYRIRNHCAHGGTTLPVGSINSLVFDIYNWVGMLRS